MNSESVIDTAAVLEMASAFMRDGGIFMWIIFWIWILGIAMSCERLKAFFVFDINGTKLMAAIKNFVISNNVEGAIATCSNSKALLPRVLKSGLKRANQSKQDIMDAMEATTVESVLKIDKRISYIALMANISTLLGLLGTIYGLIQSFAAVAQAEPSLKAKLLALGISKAMNTTALGIMASISLMVVHAFLTNKSEKILGEIGHQSAVLGDMLGSRKIVEGHQKMAA